MANAAVLGTACDGCRGEPEPRVPFKLPGSDASAASDAGAHKRAEGEPLLPQVFSRAADRPELGAAKVPLSGVWALLGVDVDQDGQQDAFALHEDAETGFALSLSKGGAEGFEDARVLRPLPPPLDLEPCTLERADVRALSKSKLLASVTRACGADKRPHTTLLLASLEATPRVFTQLEVRPTRAPSFELVPRGEDVDADGHDDAVLALRVGGESPDAELKLTWFDRPSGLVLDPREPENTLAAWASAAQALVNKTPDQAAARAALVLRLYDALCRESGGGEVVLSGSAGLPCGRIQGRAEALLTLVLAHAKRGQVREAFDAYRALRQEDPPPRTLQKVASALSTLPATQGITLRKGPQVSPSATPALRLPAARFVGDGQLFVQRREPVLYDLESGTESAVVIPTDSILRDPSGQLAATAIEHGCAGYSLRVERAPVPGNPYVSTPPVSTPLLFAEANASDCTTSRARSGGFLVLGWAPQGIVAARGAEVWVVPLSLKGQPVGTPRALDPGTPCPAPLPSGIATPDGTLHVEATPYGVLVYDRHSGGISLWRPNGYAEFGDRATEAAISPTGRKVAVVAGDQVYLLSRAP